jgi:endonuclease/exonuclease/phosphatase (EEP) superfamily protein YafD
VLAVAVAAFVTTLPRATPAPSGGQVVRVYQKNLLSLLTNPRKLVADIRGSGADIVTLEEVTSHNKHLIDALKDLYPSQTYCPGRLSGGQAVLSKYPAVGPTIPCEDSRDAAGMLVDTGRYRIWAVAIHLPWPWPYGQAEQVDAVDKLLGTLTQPIVLGGDFNMVPWANSVARIERAGSMVLAGDAGPSFKLPDLPLSIPIDHVLMPEGSRAAHSELRPAFGSDHLGVLSRFELP